MSDVKVGKFAKNLDRNEVEVHLCALIVFLYLVFHKALPF